MKKGFTLLEMIIVVTIVSILFILSVPNIQKVLGIVNEKGCDALVKVVDSAILEYRLAYDSKVRGIMPIDLRRCRKAYKHRKDKNQ